MPGLNINNLSANPPSQEPDELDPTDIDLSDIELDPKKNVLEVEYPDGSITINLGGIVTPKENTKFEDNLADSLSDSKRGRIADELLRGIESDNDSRKEWLENRAEGIKLLGLKIEGMRSQAGDGASPVEGMSQVRHPLLLEALIRFQANAFAEMFPADGPVKVRDDDPNSSPDEDSLADLLEKDLNHYLTAVDKDYVADSDALLLRVGLDGCGFKKVYHDPIKRRPVSLSVSAEDLIVSQSALSLASAGRVTHRSFMRPSIMKRMQLLGVYRDVELGDPGYAEKSPIDSETEAVSGLVKNEASEAAGSVLGIELVNDKSELRILVCNNCRFTGSDLTLRSAELWI